ncbi:MAG: hypothetical protein K0R34_1900 [Herbinix sp.]|jgi:hypothetical protein|nr:hypothetical protein [Herbinix sp.]
MRERYIPALVMLLAGAITSVLNIVNKIKVEDGLKRLLLVLVIFYFVGLIIKAIIVRTVINAPKKGDKIQDKELEGAGEEAAPVDETLSGTKK